MMTALRIALVTTFYPPYNFGGDGIYVQRLARELVSLGCDVTVIHDTDAYRLLAGGEPPRVEAVEDGVEVIGVKSGLGAVGSLMTQQFGVPLTTRGQLKRLLDDGYDVIHYHNISLIGGPAILSLGQAIKLYTAHEHWLVCPSHILWRHNRELCDHRECFRCQLAHKRPPQLWRYLGNPDKHYDAVDQFIALSQSSADNHHAFGFRHPMRVMPSFIPDVDPGPVAPVRNHGSPYAFFAGRLEVIKGLQDVIPHFSDDAPVDLLIAGTGEYEGELRKLADGKTRVRFLGKLDADELTSYYDQALAVITPSLCYEVFPLVVLEAFRAGTPIIARNLGAYQEIVDSTGAGLLFDAGHEIIDHLRQLIADRPAAADIGAQGRAAFETRWSCGPALQAYLELIKETAQAKSRDDIVDRATKTMSRHLAHDA